MREIEFTDESVSFTKLYENFDDTDVDFSTEDYDIDFFTIIGIQFVMLICIVFFALYHVANYAHPGDTQFGRSIAARIFCICGVILFLTPIAFVPVDCELKTRGWDASDANRFIWMTLYFPSICYIWIASPVLFAFYETNEKDRFCKRVWDALRIQLPLWLTLLILVVPTFFLLNEVHIPTGPATMLGLETNTEIDG